MIKFINGLTRPILYLLYSYKFINRQRIPLSGQLIVCANHLHAFDPLFIAFAALPRHICFLAKESIFRQPIIKIFYKGYKIIPINREKPDVSSIKQVLTVLKNGGAAGIFPEGTRRKNNVELEPKEGAAMFAIRTGAPVLPVRLERIKRKFWFSKVIVHIGEPFDCRGFGADSEEKPTLMEISYEIMKRIRETE